MEVPNSQRLSPFLSDAFLFTQRISDEKGFFVEKRENRRASPFFPICDNCQMWKNKRDEVSGLNY